jgi:Tfp pilus assembly protein PilZ
VTPVTQGLKSGSDLTEGPSGEGVLQLRPETRINKRLPCRVKLAGSCFGGMVLNVSRGGLFLQTTARVDPGAEMWLELNASGGREAIELGTQVVWKRVVPVSLRGVTAGGVGLKIRSAPESYYTLLMQLMTSGPAASGSPGDPDAHEMPKFRVRLKQIEGSRSRTVTLACSSEEEARRSALEQVGQGWVVLEANPV